VSNSAAAILAQILTEEAMQYISQDFISHPGRTKTRNITIWMMVVKSRNKTLMKANYENIFASYFETNFISNK